MIHQEKWSKGILHISLRDNPEGKHVKSWLKESLGIHRCLGRIPGWRITHAESGLCFPKLYPSVSQAKHEADQLLCIEGLWSNPLESFANGLREVDCNRVNSIMGKEYVKPGVVGNDLKRELERRSLCC